MNTKQKTRSHDCEAAADDALAAARKMPPGAERIEALKNAGKLRSSADARGLAFAKRGRPLK